MLQSLTVLYRWEPYQRRIEPNRFLLTLDEQNSSIYNPSSIRAIAHALSSPNLPVTICTPTGNPSYASTS